MKKIKITKEQYNRIFNSSIINENTEAGSKKPKADGKEGNDKITKEIKDLLKHLYGYTPDFNKEFWVDEKGKSSDEIIEHLVSKNLIVKKGRNYIVPKSLGTKEEAKASIDKSIRELVGEPVEVIDEDMEGGYPAGADNDPTAPYNQEDPEPILNHTDYEIFVFNDDLAILKNKRGNEFYLLDFGENHVDYEGKEMTEDDLNGFLNKNETILPEKLIPVNDEILNELRDMYHLNGYFRNKIEVIRGLLHNIAEGVDWSKAYPREKDKPKMNDITPKKRTEPENKAILDKLADLKARETKNNPPTKSKHPTEEPDELDETSCAGGSAGAFVAPMGTEPIKREIKETLSVAGAGNFQYDTPGLANIGRNGEFKKGKKKTKAEITPQWANGSFVEQPECSKPNNNKEAQNGGCNSGASSLKMKKASGSVNAPSLAEGLMREALKLQHDRNQGKLIVISDLEGRAASQETFHNKAVLKQNGFNWNGTNWVIDSNKLDIAKKTLSLVNKAEYIIDQLEDLEDAVENSTADNKDLLKARIDQYIIDLANATDEVALSAEIRRYLTFFSKFHSYSFYNRMLIFIQKPDATKVGSFKLWETKFRRVKKGSKAIKVLAPLGSPKVDTSTSSDDAELDTLGSRPMVTRFRAVNVFDVSDTEPIDERGDVPDSPQWFSENTPSETADILFNTVSEVATDLGIRVTQSDANGSEKGYSAGDHINISSDVSGAARLSTTIHEIAHELMHWKKSSIYFIDNGEGRLKNELQELQAESVSYVVLKHYGIPVSHHATYLALWKANKERIHNNLEIISKVAQFIIDKIDKQVTNTEKQ